MKEQLSWDFKTANYYNAESYITRLVLCNLSFQTFQFCIILANLQAWSGQAAF